MAAEISPESKITVSNQPEFFQVPDHSPLPEGAEWVRHSRNEHTDLHAEMHEALRILREIEVVLSRFRPLLDQVITSPLATRRAMRKAGRDGG